jgi:succinate dehydrogenase / fumarate reductase iron-sulfur subunit
MPAVQAFTITLNIRRFQPEVDQEARWQSFDVEVYSTDRVLDALHKIKWEQDGTLSFRRSCAHGICGSDAMRINGRNRLACKTLIKDLDITQPIYVEAIKGLPLEKDLIVDMEPFFAAFREVKPFLIANSKPEKGKERIQSIANRETFDDTTKCILCAACTTSCTAAARSVRKRCALPALAYVTHTCTLPGFCMTFRFQPSADMASLTL